VKTPLDFLRWLFAHFRRSRAPEPTLTLSQALAEPHPQPHGRARFNGPPRFFRRHVLDAAKPTRRGRKCRARIIQLAARKGLG
jgi:hypothetical protein